MKASKVHQSLENNGFIFNQGAGVWQPVALPEFAYNDGDDAENYVLDVVTQAQDLSVNSLELSARMKDWPSIYHLSARRSNLLKPFEPYLKGKRILEIGCGCGAITRFLVENGAQVVSVEGSFRRARIARQRCRGLDNVDVICSPSDQLPDMGSFDAVMLIGVLEYASIFLGSNGQRGLLDYCRQQLAKDGKLFVAIENKLGIKYFAGANEDHIGLPMFGINNSYHENGVITFGRYELLALLNESGFIDTKEYIPLPDYKLPVSIITPTGWQQYTQELSPLAIESSHKDIQGVPEDLFSVEQGLRNAWSNNLAVDLANSFLVVASQQTQTELTAKVAAYHYTDGRLPQFNKVTTFEVTEQGKLVVNYSPMIQAEPEVAAVQTIKKVDQFYIGDSLWLELVDVVNRPDWTLQQIAEWAKEWVDSLLSKAEVAANVYNKDLLLAGHYQDAMPFNAIRQQDGVVVFFDLEWHTQKTIALGYVVFRGLFHSLLRLTSVANSQHLSSLNISTLSLTVMNLLGFRIEQGELNKYLTQESEFIARVENRNSHEIYQVLRILAMPMRVVSVAAIKYQLIDIEKKHLHQEQLISAKDAQVVALQESIIAKDAQVVALQESIIAKDAQVVALQKSITAMEHQIAQQAESLIKYEQQVQQIFFSSSWKFSAPLRVLGRKMPTFLKKPMRGVFNRVFNLLQRCKSWLGSLLRSAKQNIKFSSYQSIMVRVKFTLRKLARSLYYRLPERYRGRLLNVAMKLRPGWFLHHPQFNYMRKVIYSPIQTKEIFVDVSTLSDSLCASSRKVAVHCHIFYHDLISEFEQHLATVPFPFSVFVSVATEEAKNICLSVLNKVSYIEHLVVKVVPNRGRDIAPMFAEFGNELKGYDYIAHIQGKKSLYNNGATLGWREYLFNSLFGSTINVKRIFSLFDNNKQLGIVYPQAFTQIPYAAFTWLANRADGANLCDRMGIPMPESYFNFPAGSMFWARVDALRPLFDLNLSWQDFPDESGQTDGTTAHAIERLLGIVPTATGYETAILKDMQTPSWSPFRLDHQYLPRNKETYSHLIADVNTKIVAFDIFDTLLVRPLLNPDHTKQLVARQLESDERKLFENYRVLAESQARQRKEEVNLDDIYAEFSCLAGMDQERANHIRLLEEKIELGSVSPRDEVVDLIALAKKSGKRVVLISDMFLSKTTIEAMLENNNVIGWDELYLSSDRGCRKESGALYELMMKEESVQGNEVVMVGDNERSDLQLPADFFGIRCLHLFRANDMARCLPTYADYVSPNIINDIDTELTAGLLIRQNLNKIADFTEKDINLFYSDPFKIGFNVVGPVVLSFCQWLLEKTKADKIHALYFLAREGKLIKQIYDLWTSSLQDAPKSHYLQLSRRAATVPNIISFDDIKTIAQSDYFLNEPHYFLYERFGLELSGQRWQEIYNRGLWKEGQLLEIRQKNIQHILGLLEFLSPDIFSQGLEEKKALDKYLDNCKLTSSGSVAVVDVGYSGTIQKALNRLVAEPVHGYYLATADNIRDGMSPLAKTHGCYVNESIACFDGSRIFSDNFKLEQLLSANEAQILKYIMNENDQLVPVFKELREKEILTRSVRNELQSGCIAFVAAAVKVRETIHPEYIPALQFADALYRGLMIASETKQSSVLAQLILDDDYCGRGLIG